MNGNDESISSTLDSLISTEEESFEKILLELLDPQNIRMKTEIQKPLTLTKLGMLAEWARVEGFDKLAAYIEKFIEIFLENMVSNLRKSREEITQVLSEGIKRERSMAEKLTEPPT